MDLLINWIDGSIKKQDRWIHKEIGLTDLNKKLSDGSLMKLDRSEL